MKHLLTFIIFEIILIFGYNNEIHSQTPSYVNVLEYLTDNLIDCTEGIQKAIDENPNRVIYFPDGIYKISSPILTPAEPSKSVSLELSNYAIIQPFEGWNNDEALVCLGGKEPSNTILIPGSNYYISGGVIDCLGIAKGISIDSGRETNIRGISIKNTVIGIHIKNGANCGSSDADVCNVNITGNMGKNSIGVLVEGHDNTFTNIRIYRTQIGVKLCSGANILRNVHTLYGSLDDLIYEDGCGFVNEKGNNWYDFCYSDQYATGFHIQSGFGIYNNCYAYWYSNRGEKHTAFRSCIPFNSTVTNFIMGLNNKNATKNNIILEELDTTRKGNGCFQNLLVSAPELITSDDHKKYVE